jgi:hypothetical protein
VVDPYTLLALLAGIALAAYFLRLALVAKLARKKRDVGLNDVTHHVSTGRRIDAISQGPKTLEFQGPTLSHLP